MYGTCSFSEQRWASEHWIRSTNNASGFTSATSRARTSLGPIHSREREREIPLRSAEVAGLTSVRLCPRTDRRNNIPPAVRLSRNAYSNSQRARTGHPLPTLPKFACIKIQSRSRVDSYISKVAKFEFIRDFRAVRKMLQYRGVSLFFFFLYLLKSLFGRVKYTCSENLTISRHPSLFFFYIFVTISRKG